jgi:hypothetical protein
MKSVRGAIVGLVAVSIGILVLASGAATAATAVPLSPKNAAPLATGAGCNYVTFVYFAQEFYNGNESVWACAIHATNVLGKKLPVHGWSNTIFEVSCAPACQSKITIADYGYAGDDYSLWVTDDSSLATDWAMVGTTPQVDTSSALTAPGYNSHWTGTGSTYSQKTFYVYDPDGIAEFFAIHDNLMGAMTTALDGPCGVSAATLLSSGCSASGISVGAGWSPAGFGTSWTNSP